MERDRIIVVLYYLYVIQTRYEAEESGTDEGVIRDARYMRYCVVFVVVIVKCV